MKGPSSFPRIICLLLLLALAGSTAFAGEPQVRREEDRGLTPRTETNRQLGKAQEKKAPGDMPMADFHKLWLQCSQSEEELKEQFAALQLQNTSLQQQLQVVQQKLNDATHPGGSAVTAYCESPSVSRNTAGATTNCGLYRCEEVSGLCRTQCNLASECNGVCNSTQHECIP